MNAFLIFCFDITSSLFKLFFCFLQLKFSKENPAKATALEQVKLKDSDKISEELVRQTLRRAVSFHSTLQAHDGHWPGDYGGPMFLMPGLVSPNLMVIAFYTSKGSFVNSNRILLSSNAY